MEISSLNITTPDSPDMKATILQSPEIQKKISGCQNIAFELLHCMYTMDSRAAAYKLSLDQKVYRVVVRFNPCNGDCGNPLKIQEITIQDPLKQARHMGQIISSHKG